MHHLDLDLIFVKESKVNKKASHFVMIVVASFLSDTAIADGVNGKVFTSYNKSEPATVVMPSRQKEVTFVITPTIHVSVCCCSPDIVIPGYTTVVVDGITTQIHQN